MAGKRAIENYAAKFHVKNNSGSTKGIFGKLKDKFKRWQYNRQASNQAEQYSHLESSMRNSPAYVIHPGLKKLIESQTRRALYNEGDEEDPALSMYLGRDVAEADQSLMWSMKGLYGFIRKKHRDWSRRKVLNYMEQTIARALSEESGEEEHGGGLERKTRTGIWGRTLKTGRFMKGTGSALEEAGELFKKGDYDPVGIRKAAETVRYLEKLDETLGIFRKYGVVGPINKYLSSRSIHAAAKTEVGKVQEGMGAYL
mgnify:FL=1